jgi:hypothetical protein
MNQYLNVRDYFEDLGVDGRTISKRMLRKHSVMLWIGFIWLRIETNGGLL